MTRIMQHLKFKISWWCSDIKPFCIIGLFVYLLKIPQDYMFYGGIERDQWHKMS